MSDKKWFSSGVLAARPAGKVDRERGIIEGVSVCTEGEASGHGVWLDGEFIDRVTALGTAKSGGLKARFGHPNMCSTALGTFVGRFKNFRTEPAIRDDGAAALRTIADLFVSNEARDTPNGNLYDYIFNMAEKEPDMFGTSIVFSSDEPTYKRDKDGKKIASHDEDGKYNREYAAVPGFEYAVCSQLQGCDLVDEPAANDGLFSRFANETVAGQVTQFLDLHPQVWDALTANPSILEALAKYGKKADEFFAAYQSYKAKTKEAGKMSEEANTVAAESETEVVNEVEEVKPEVAAEPETKDETVLSVVPPVADAPKVAPVLSREEFSKIADEFGAEIAVQTMRDGGNYFSALRCAYDAMKLRCESLEKERAETKLSSGGVATPVSDATKAKTSLFNTGK